MDQTQAAAELISQYGTYAEAGDLNIGAVSDPPATTPLCVISSVTIVSATVVTNDAGR